MYCQIGDPPTVESGRTVASKDPVMKCFVTDGADASLTGQVVIFFKVRVDDKRGPSLTEAITMGFRRLMSNPFIVMLLTSIVELDKSQK